MTEDEIIRYIKDEFPNDEIQEIHGPSRFGDTRLWEVWTLETVDNEYMTRFVAEFEKSTPQRFRGFQDLIDALELQRASVAKGADKAEFRARAQTEAFYLRRLSAYVAALTFVATVVSFLYLLVVNPDARLMVATVLADVIASGGALFFGKWIRP